MRNSVMLETQANLYDFGRTSAAIKAGRAAQTAASSQGAVTREQLVGQVRSAYLAWLSAFSVQRIAAQAARDAEAMRARIAAYVSEGVRPRAELAPADAEALLSKLEAERAQGDLEQARLALEYAVAGPLPESAEPDLGELEQTQLPQAPEESALSRTLTLQRSAAQNTALMHQRERAPILGAVGSAGVRGQAYSVFPTYALGVTFSWPLWDGGIAAADADAARAQAAGFDAQLRQEQQRAAHDRKEADLQASHANTRLELATALLATAEAHAREAQEAYELGVQDQSHVSQARTLLRRAHTEVLLAKVARTEARLRTQPMP